MFGTSLDTPLASKLKNVIPKRVGVLIESWIWAEIGNLITRSTWGPWNGTELKEKWNLYPPQLKMSKLIDTFVVWDHRALHNTA